MSCQKELPSGNSFLCSYFAANKKNPAGMRGFRQDFSGGMILAQESGEGLATLQMATSTSAKGKEDLFRLRCSVKWPSCFFLKLKHLRRLPRRIFTDCFEKAACEGQPCGRSLRSCRRNRSPSPEIHQLTSQREGRNPPCPPAHKKRTPCGALHLGIHQIYGVMRIRVICSGYLIWCP